MSGSKRKYDRYAARANRYRVNRRKEERQVNSVLERIKSLSAQHVSRRVAESREAHMAALRAKGWAPLHHTLGDIILGSGCPVETVNMGKNKRPVPWVPVWVVLLLENKKLSSRGRRSRKPFRKSSTRSMRKRLRALVQSREEQQLLVADHLLSAGADDSLREACNVWMDMERPYDGPR